MSRHFDAKHNGITYECTHCSFKTNRNDNLRRHVQTIHSTEKKLCDVCGIEFEKNEFLIHQREHKKRKRFEEIENPAKKARTKTVQDEPCDERQSCFDKKFTRKLGNYEVVMLIH